MSKQLTLPWQQWIETLNKAAETLPGWDQAAAFAADVLRIADLKQRSNLEAALNNLHSQAQVLESFFQTGPVLAWNVSSFCIQRRPLAAALSADLCQALLAFQKIQSREPATYSEWLNSQAEAQTIANRIPSLYSELNGLRQPEETMNFQIAGPPLQAPSSQPSVESGRDQDPEPLIGEPDSARVAPPTELATDPIAASIAPPGLQALESTEDAVLPPPSPPSNTDDTTHAEAVPSPPVEPEQESEVAETLEFLATDDEYPVSEPQPSFTAVSAPSATQALPVSELLPVLRKSPGEAFWSLVAAGRLALAYHIARVTESAPNPILEIPRSDLVRAAALGLHVAVPYGEIARMFSESVGHIENNPSDGDKWPIHCALLALAAALRPALIAPGNPISWLLRDALRSVPFHGVREYCSALAEFSDRGHPLAPNALKDVKDKASAQKELLDLQEEVREWRSRAPSYTILMDRAADVWRHWLRSDSCVGRLLEPVDNNDLARAPSVRALIAQCSDGHEVARLVDSTDRDQVHLRGGRPIRAGALKQLRSHLKEAVDMASRWLNVCERLPTTSIPAPYESEVRTKVKHLEASVLSEVREWVETADMPARAAAQLLVASVQDVAAIFDSKIPFSTAEPAVLHLLSAELLSSPDLSLDENWMPELDEKSLGALCDLAGAKASDDWRATFQRQLEAGNHEATECILSYLQSHPDPKIDVQELTELRRADLQPSRELLRSSVEQTVRHIDGALALSLIGETEFTRYKGKADNVEGAIERTSNFRRAKARLNNIREELAQKTGPHLESARRRFEEQLGGRIGSSEYNRIDELLDKDDFLTANEYLDRLERGDLLPDADSDTARFRRVFPEVLQSVDILLRPDQFLRDLLPTIRERKELLGTSLQEVLSRDQAEYAAGALKTWYRVKQGKGTPLPTVDDIRDILTFLGFANVHVSGADRTARLTCYPVRCDVPKCPIPTYGSAAEGRYRVVCAFDRKNEADIVEDLGTFPTGAPFVVLYFGPMGPQERRSLAQLCRAERRTLLLVDDLMLVWLCTVKPSRIQALFEVALPFTHLRPYTSKPGFVPREMFYGRERERESIVSPSGACFIFGGRQLGKSALLRQVRDSFHNPDIGHIAILIDLANSIRTAMKRPIDELWTVLQRELEVVKFDFRGDINVGPDTLFRQIEEWLRLDSSRRILLLLDEADDFFDIDAKQKFAYVRRFKELMEKPGIDRRFKVVFAGLHNVQRTTRDVNNPLAHLQDAVCIGPLLESGEWRQAQALIERPLASLGYFFESRDLLMPILSKTNYYPSLIQLFCIRLIDEFDDPKSRQFDSKQSPPYILKKKHVDRICTDLELRKQIKFRFDLTLDLDPRYRAIAYTVAWETIYQQARLLKDGIDWQTIRTRALEWSPPEIWGYTAEDNFRVLVDEMVGLGVLRRVIENESRYALRSPNVLSFMGTDDEIYDGLQRIRPENDGRYDAETFRASVSGDAVHAHIRSPLTAQQTSTLTERKNGVSLVFGSAALGFDHLPEFLEAAFDTRFIVTCAATNDAEFRSWTDDLRKRDLQNLVLALVPANCPWNASWVESALARVARLRSERGNVRFLFLADPVKNWSWFGETAGRRKQMIEAGLATFELQKWHEQAFAQWTSECHLTLTTQELADVARLTGCWPALIMDLFQFATPSLRASIAIPKLAESLKNPAECSAILTAMGFEDSLVAREVLKAIGGNGNNADDIHEYFNDDAVYSIKTIARALNWAEKLQLVRAANSPFGIQTWTVDPVVADLLKTAAGASVNA